MVFMYLSIVSTDDLEVCFFLEEYLLHLAFMLGILLWLRYNMNKYYRMVE